RRAWLRAAVTLRLCRLVLLDLGLERLRRLRPELIEPGAQRAETVRIDLVDVARAVGAVEHEAGVFQRLQMLRDRRAADGQFSRKLADRARGAREPLGDFPPSRVGEGGEGEGSVSHDLQ